jgi:hypothetical protein
MSTIGGSGSFHFNPKLVTDGLIWAIDIANNASYIPPTSTTISDLTINNYNFNLISSSGRPYTYNSNNLGSINFFNDLLNNQTSGSEARLLSSINTGANFSVFFWVNPSVLSGNTGRYTIMTNAYNFNSGKSGWFLLATSARAFGLSIGTDDSTYNSGADRLTTGSWSYIGFTVTNSGGTIRAYQNGVLLGTSNVLDSTSINYSFQTSSLARRIIPANQPDRFSGSLAAGHIYNRVLTPQEVGQNYNAYKSRFGLT